MPEQPPQERRLSDAEALRLPDSPFISEKLGPPKTSKDIEEDKARNKKRAETELNYIEALRDNSAFQWFFDRCIRPGFKTARDELEAAQTDPKELPRVASRFHVWRRIIRWLDEREREHRRLLNPDDPQLAEIRKRLDLH